jgi:hypothetical protein
MPPQDLLQAGRRRPFVTFRLHVSDGTVYEVRHPEMLMVALASAVVGLPAKDRCRRLWIAMKSWTCATSYASSLWRLLPSQKATERPHRG